MILRNHYKPLKQIKDSGLFNDSVWSFIGNTIGRGLSVFAGIFIARYLGKDVFGEYGIIKTTLIYLEIFSTFGLGYTATRFIANVDGESGKVRSIIGTVYRITFVASGVISIFLFIFAPYVANFLAARTLTIPLRIASFGIFFNAINIAQIGVLSGLRNFKSIAKNITVSGIITFGLTIPLTFFFGLNGAIISLVLSFGCQCFFNWVSISSDLEKVNKNRNFNGQTELQKEILLFSLPVALQESLYAIFNWTVSYLLIRLSGYGELGLYTAAGQWTAVIAFIPGILRNVTLAHLSNTKDYLTRRSMVKIMMTVNGLCTSVISLITIVLSGIICSFYGKSFSNLQNVLIISSITPIFSSISNVFVQDFMSIGKNWLIFWSKLIRDLTILLFSYLIIVTLDLGGAISLSATCLCANIVYTFLLMGIYVVKFQR